MSDQYREEWFKPGNLRSRTEQTTANNISYQIDQLNRSVVDCNINIFIAFSSVDLVLA